MKHLKPSTLLFLSAGLTAALAAGASAEGESSPPKPPYADDPAILAKVQALGPNQAAMLGRFRVEPPDAAKYHGSFKNGPQRRDYGNKLVYAPDRRTALYCGANHNSPHRLNDVWEFHLGSNTWHLICPPGTDATRLRAMQNDQKKLNDAIAKGTNVETNKVELESIQARMKAWYAGIEVKDGYLQDKANGGPVEPWHTWDGLSYDHRARRLHWAVLDSDNYTDEKQRVHRMLTRRYATATGQDPEALVAQLKPGSSMYVYDPQRGRWTRQLGEPPFPLMRGMGGSLTYLPDRDLTVWYACVGNVSGGYTEGMWAYNATSNRWHELLSGGKVSGQMRAGTAPGGEVQMAYSERHGTIVAVQNTNTFVYVVSSNTWSRTAGTPSYAHDAKSVFAYDSNADVFLLLGKSGGQWSREPWKLAAYDVAANQWELIDIKGDPLPQDHPERAWDAQAFAGYYDPEHNVFVLYCGRGSSTWVYRHAARPR